MKSNIHTTIAVTKPSKSKDRMYDGVISGDVSGKSPVILVWYCKDIRDGYRGLEWASKQLGDNPRDLQAWKRLWRNSCAMTTWGGFKYQVPGEPDREAAFVFFCKRFWRIRTVVHESSHILKALYSKVVKKCANSAASGKHDEVLADLQASMVYAICEGGRSKLGAPKA